MSIGFNANLSAAGMNSIQNAQNSTGIFQGHSVEIGEGEVVSAFDALDASVTFPTKSLAERKISVLSNPSR